MIKATSTKLKHLAPAVALVAALGAMAISRPASAAFTDDTVGVIEYMHPNGIYNLLIQLSGSTSVNYTAYNNPAACTTSGCTTCPAIAMDTIKAWTSLAQSALLSGKGVRIYYNTCSVGGTNNISGIVGIDLKK